MIAVTPDSASTASRAQTRSVQAGVGTDQAHRAVMPPIYLSSNFVFDAPGVCGRYDYTRSGNPTRDLCAEAIAALEGGVGGVVVSSGMAAVAMVTRLLVAGDVLVAPHDCYGGTQRLFVAESHRGNYSVHFVDQQDPGTRDAVRALRPRMIWLETPSNPMLRITDIAAWARLAREIGAVCVVDNTFLSPVNQQPLRLGADIAVHSTTKFLNGHSDVVGGAIVASSNEVLEELAWWTNCVGAAAAPFDSYMTLRGIRTLHARIRVHEENTLRIVDALTDAQNDTVKAVHHPGLPDHLGHDIALAQQQGWGSMVSFELRNGRAAVNAFLKSLRHFVLAESLGGVESLVAHPATMTHAAMSQEARDVAGIGEGLLRLSVGLEAPHDLVADLQQALARAGEAACQPA